MTLTDRENMASTEQSLSDLIDGAKNTLRLRSDRALSRHLKKNEQYIRGVRGGSIDPSEEIVIWLAEMAGKDPAFALFDLRARTAKDPKVRRIYEAAKKLARHGFLALALTYLILPSSNNGLVFGNLYDNPYCATLSRFRRLIIRARQSLFPTQFA